MNWLNDLSIRWKLVAVTVLTSFLALVFAGGIMARYDNEVYRTQKSREASSQAQILAAGLTASLVFHDGKATQEYLDALRANPEIEAAAAYGADNQLVARYGRAGGRVDLVPTLAPPPGERFNGDDLTASVLVTQGPQGSQGIVGTVALVVNTEPLLNRHARYSGIMLLAVLGSLSVAVPVSMRLNAAISDPIRHIAAAASRITAGDLGVKVDGPTRGDEIGVLLETFGQMVVSLREMTGEVGSGAKVLADTASTILASTTQVATGSSEAATAIGETTVTMEEVKQTVQMSAEKAQQVSEGAQRTAQVAQSGREAVEAVVLGMARIREQVEAVAGSILRLSEQGQAIGEIIAAVSDLADQSNLLAVNAAIEAARAGEQGRGFAVVAQEVKSLADQSKQATTQVRQILGEIQKATGAAVLATEQGTKAVDSGVKQSEQAGEAIRVLAENIELAAQAAVQIAASSQQQLAGVSQVALAMENIRQASSQNAAGIKRTEAAARDLNELGQKLRALVQKYRV